MLLLVMQVVATLQTSAPTDAERDVRDVQRHVEAGQVSALRFAVDARVRAAPEDRRALLRRATLDRLTYRVDVSARTYQALADGSDEVAAHARLGAALLALQEFRLPEADRLLRLAAAEFARLRDAHGQAQALGHLGMTVGRLVSLDSAAAVYATAQRLAPEDQWLRLLLRCQALTVEVRRTRPRAAEEARTLVAKALAAGNPRAATACLSAVGQDFERRTLPDSALAVFAEVADIQRRTGNLAGLAVTRQWQGYVFQSRGRYGEARAALEEAVALGERTRAHAATAWAALNFAQIALTLGDMTTAGRYARTARTRFAELGDRWGQMSARAYEGEVALLTGDAAAARASFEEVARLAPDVQPSMSVHALGRLAFASLLDGDAVGALSELDSAARLARRLDMPAWLLEEDVYGRARVALQQRDFDTAIALLRRLLQTLPADQRGARADVYARLAEAAVGKGDVPAAERELRAAASVVDSLRADPSRSAFRRAVLNARHLDWDRDLGFATVVAGLVEAGRIASAFTFAEQRRARVLLEQLLRRRATTDAPQSVPYPLVTVDSIARTRVPAGTALLSFVVGSGAEPTTVFVLTGDSLRAVRAASIDAHSPELERFRGLVAAGDVPRELSRRLGAAFLHAALRELPPGVEQLVIVPDGQLHHLPFDVLSDAEGRLLVERFAISRVPSARVVGTRWRTVPRPARGHVIAFGDPTGVRLRGAVGDSIPPALPAAAREAERVARYAPASMAFTGLQARESTLRRLRFDTVSVLHFATHADVDNASFLQSALLLAPGDGEDGALRGDELSMMHLPVPLVVLSACNSGAGAVLSGEGLQGLVAPFLEAGASSVVASLWSIEDVAAADMIERMYAALASGQSVGDALWQAKRAAMTAGVSPAVWAAFTVTGDARVRPALRPPAPRLSDLLGGSADAGALVLPLILMVALGSYGVLRTKRRRNGEGR
ncbi:MAG: CHAT domain-containing protein [Gemmatimonadaceae bacterium]|jgi:tetratricopeptide (TPR) repeat protein|nr:CHAT domain-containing protein [Gemmatimonadaceae bacterium]